MRINLRKEKGITLVALIITIVILIILAAVTISSVMHDGFIDVAINGTQNYAKEQYREVDEISKLADKLNDAVDKINDNTGGDPTSNWDKDKVYPVESEDKVPVPVPIGFTPSNVDGEKTVEDGFVIKQDGTANEFVWVPVPNPSEMFTTDTEGTPAGQLYDFNKTTKKANPIAYSNEGCREPDILTDDTCGDASTEGIEKLKNIVGIVGDDTETILNWENQLKREFLDMKTSIETYKGFYIGRYETGNLSTSRAVVAKNNTDINSVSWYEMYQRSKTIVEGTGVASSMIWGSQWDATLRWFIRQGGKKAEYVYDSTDKGHYIADNPIPTGSESRYSVNNIYDMAGNEYEWTLEAYSNATRVLRRI